MQKTESADAVSAAASIETLLNVKPAVGFTLPSAGVTPAPNEKKRCGTSSLLEAIEQNGERVGDNR
jgi:hypothetical protein